LECALRLPHRWRTVRRAALVLGAIAAAAALAMSLRPSFARALLVRDLLVATAGFVVLAVLATIAGRHARTTALMLLVLAAADLYRVNGKLLPTVSWSDALREPSSARAIQRGTDPLRIYSDAVGRPAVSSFPDAFLQEQNLLLMEVANYYGIANLNAPASINLRDHERLATLIEQVPDDRVAPLLAAVNTAYVTSPKNLQRYTGLAPLLKPSSPAEAYVYRVEGVAPRAYVPRTLEAVAAPPDAIEHLRHNPAPAEHVAVERRAVPRNWPPVMEGTVRIAAYRPQEVELIATLRTDGLVVLTDTFYPGWEATVDGTPAPIARANYFARGVFARAGERRIVFRYRPLSYWVGSIISLATCLALLIGLLGPRAPRLLLARD
jgi:hypothetical protein